MHFACEGKDGDNNGRFFSFCVSYDRTGVVGTQRWAKDRCVKTDPLCAGGCCFGACGEDTRGPKPSDEVLLFGSVCGIMK